MSARRTRPARWAGALLAFWGAAALIAAPAQAQSDVSAEAASTAATVSFDIPAQDLGEALADFARQSGQEMLYAPSTVAGKTSSAINGRLSRPEAMGQLLEGTGLLFEIHESGSMIIGDEEGIATYRARLQSSAIGGERLTAGAKDIASARRNGVEEIIVTGQKKEERIQDVPIAISAFTMEDLDAQKLEGGFDLLKAIPNVTFSKSNFTGYNFSIRGVGTKAISATTDPGVAVSFNNAGLIQNRLFEQEYFDVERIEVLRGPQGTLYGRNATGGVVNVISARPELGVFKGSLKSEVGNYGARRGVGMINIPIASDILALRVSGAFTQRDGYGFNDRTGNAIDGRDLWSSRTTLSFQPSDGLRADLIWEHFSEDDNRARTSKQLCHHDEGPAVVGGQQTMTLLQRALFSTGCQAGSLYHPNALGTPNGLALPQIFAIPGLVGMSNPFNPGRDPETGEPVTLFDAVDPYAGLEQNRDLRTISSLRDPEYRAQADVYQINIDLDLGSSLILVSQTVYNEDSVYSTQDYNRFNTRPIFNDSSNWLSATSDEPSAYRSLSPGGILCDPQLGCSNSIVGQDISSATGEQITQEIRLQSNFDGVFNFSLGANYTKFEVAADYYVFYNVLTALARMPPLNLQPDYTKCTIDGTEGGELVDIDDPRILPYHRCIYTDPNPLESISGEGHNYFRSRNPYTLHSKAIFGELYWGVADDVQLTVGLRVTDDRKTFTPVASQLLLSPLIFIGGGTTYRGYPEDPDLVQKWTEPTGRLVLDWKPEVAFTDESLIYASYSRGYKGGGANPPSIGFDRRTIAEGLGAEPGQFPMWDVTLLELTAVNYPDTFDPEYVDAFEIGAKNTLFGGSMLLNATGFFYDYEGYQVSKIVDRTAVNENFDAQVWGLEVEMLLVPSENWMVNANVGFLKTRIGSGAKSIDITNRTQGNPEYVVVMTQRFLHRLGR